ncbi:response regulator [Paenibacillus sp. N4]|uniref:response regulator transcription factor n=1 Tax=Paenibacillus vietnamensis TaxID=2590547 RepID=UPI001CD0ED06|nr:response regulator [Paenibacillus vietnamensis]MCA0754221.1 response regulator [Paenibacillus vietnamensis]
MYRVLIVDDEPIISSGIHSFIDWEKEGMSAEEDCANGEEALAALETSPFDILITDIKMPLLNGIELVRQALARYPSLKVILISNYSDFEYVKEGLKLGAVDYLLKLTLNRDDLLAVLKRCISMLEEERRKDDEQVRFREDALYRTRKSVEQEIKRVIAQEQLSLSSAAWAPAWLEKRYICAYLMLDGAEEWANNHGYLNLLMLLEDLQESFYAELSEGAAMPVSENGIFLLFPDPDGEEENLLQQWKRTAEAQWGISISAGFVIEQGAGRILDGFFCSREACQRRFFEGKGGLYRARGSEEAGERTLTEPEGKRDWTPFYEIIRNGDPISIAADFAYEQWKSGEQTPEQVKHEACRLVSLICERHEGAGPLLPERLDLLRQAETLEQLQSELVILLEEIVKPVIPDLTNSGYSGQLIIKALNYITEHYTDNLTLQSVADIIHLNKSYFSLLFKKQTGRNFIDYLIELRIREAKRLLAQSESRIYDVAGAAGFKDVKYFSKMFKKTTGFTPVEYRDKHRPSGPPCS